LIHGNTVEQFYLATVQPKVFSDRNGTIAYQELMACVGQPIADELAAVIAPGPLAATAGDAAITDCCEIAGR
jgi:hypothetical protein